MIEYVFATVSWIEKYRHIANVGPLLPLFLPLLSLRKMFLTRCQYVPNGKGYEKGTNGNSDDEEAPA